MAPSTTTVIKCPSCAAPVRFAEGEEQTRCEACNVVVVRNDVAAQKGAAPFRGSASEGGGSGGEVPRGAIAVLAVVLGLLVGLYGMREYKRRLAAKPRAPKPAPTAPVLDVPPVSSTTPAADAIAWEAEARAPVPVAADDDEVEDVLGFFRAWDGRSAWISYAGVFRGKDLSPAWRSEPLDPWILRRGEGVVPTAVVVGKHAVLADTGDTLRVYNVATGERESTFKLGGDVLELCKAPEP